MLCREGGQDLNRIIADRDDGDARSVEVGETALQLDELRPAERSPGGAAVEDDQRSPSRPPGVQVDRLAELIRQQDVGERFADGGTD
jgi:hypothetical protein